MQNKCINIMLPVRSTSMSGRPSTIIASFWTITCLGSFGTTKHDNVKKKLL